MLKRLLILLISISLLTGFSAKRAEAFLLFEDFSTVLGIGGSLGLLGLLFGGSGGGGGGDSGGSFSFFTDFFFTVNAKDASSNEAPVNNQIHNPVSTDDSLEESNNVSENVANSPETAPVPEPATMTLFASGLFGMEMLRRRRNKVK